MHDPASNPAAFLGAELRRARVAAGFTSQEALAARLGYARTVIDTAEHGERPRLRKWPMRWRQSCSPGPSGWSAGCGLARRAGGRSGVVRGLA
jgi:hypothetical protein